MDGEATYAGLVYCNGYYYYINSSKTAVRDRSYFPTYTNGLIEVSSANTYYFDELGRLKQGLYVDDDGETRYYEMGVPSYAGLVYWNGYYYYINSSKTAVKSQDYWITYNNGLMESALYTFDEQGRMVNPPTSVSTMGIDEGIEEYVAPASATAVTTTEEHQYYYAGGKLLREEVTTTAGTSTNSYTLDFVYDQSGRPYAFYYGNVYYYYITNLQGDVMSIVDGAGNVVASYEYDPYGNVIESAGILAEINPLRYRGYVYDSETDLYYLQSRYYDPAIGRFINADAYASTGQGIIGNNMFAYCGNNPVNCVDPDGHFLLPVPTLQDYYYVHKMVQMLIVLSEGYAMEVYVTSPIGNGRLDLFDAENNQFYEVKHEWQGDTQSTRKQLDRYSQSTIHSLMFIGYSFDSSPSPGTRTDISGQFQYQYWDVTYESLGNGVITYSLELNKERYARHLNTVLTVVAGGLAGALWGYSAQQHGGIIPPQTIS